MSARAQPRTGFGKDSLEIESYVRGLARRRPDVVVTTLRLANLMGAGVDSHVTRYLSLPVVPRVMGFDARLQFLHPSDAVAALLLVTDRDVSGTFNVGAADIVTLTQALHKMERPTIGVPQPATPLVATLVRRARLVDFSADQIDALTYGRAMDTSHFTTETGFVPKFSSVAALEEFVSAAKPGLLNPERVDIALDAASRLLRTAGARSG
jgi:UDP-glucose 4-epimerase